MDAPISIYLTNLGKYNEGELVGEWVELPVDDDFEQAFKDIGIGTTDEFGQPYEEWFITDYETDFGLSIGEYENIYELNEMAKKLEELGETDKIKVEAYLDYFGGTIDDALESIDNAYIFWDCSTMEDVARQYAEDIDYEFGDDILETYFDYDSFGRNKRYDLEDWAYQDYLDENDGSDEGYESPYDGMSDYEVAEYYIDNMLGSISELGEDTLVDYFDYESFGRDMDFEHTFVFIGDDCVEFF